MSQTKAIHRPTMPLWALLPTKSNHTDETEDKFPLRDCQLGDFCERLIKEYLKSQGFDKFYEVQNKSRNGVDIIAENTQTGEVKVIEG